MNEESVIEATANQRQYILDEIKKIWEKHPELTLEQFIQKFATPTLSKNDVDWINNISSNSTTYLRKIGKHENYHIRYDLLTHLEMSKIFRQNEINNLKEKYRVYILLCCGLTALITTLILF